MTDTLAKHHLIQPATVENGVVTMPAREVITVIAGLTVKPVVATETVEHGSSVDPRQRVADRGANLGREVEERCQIEIRSSHGLEGSIAFGSVVGRVGSQVGQNTNDACDSVELAIGVEGFQRALQAAPVHGDTVSIGAECGLDDTQLLGIIGLREYLRGGKALELQILGHQDRSSLTMRIGVIFAPAPNAHVGPAHQILQRYQLARIHHVPVDLLRIATIGVDALGTGPAVDKIIEQGISAGGIGSRYVLGQ